jgi:hypothetical protein
MRAMHQRGGGLKFWDAMYSDAVLKLRLVSGFQWRTDMHGALYISRETIVLVS